MIKTYPLYNIAKIDIDALYNFFAYNNIERFIVDMYRFKPINSLDTMAIPLINDCNGYTIIIMIDFQNTHELYTLHIYHLENKVSLRIKTDHRSIRRAISDIKDSFISIAFLNPSSRSLFDYVIYVS